MKLNEMYFSFFEESSSMFSKIMTEGSELRRGSFTDTLKEFTGNAKEIILKAKSKKDKAMEEEVVLG